MQSAAVRETSASNVLTIMTVFEHNIVIGKWFRDLMWRTFGAWTLVSVLDKRPLNWDREIFVKFAMNRKWKSMGPRKVKAWVLVKINIYRVSLTIFVGKICSNTLICGCTKLWSSKFLSISAFLSSWSTARLNVFDSIRTNPIHQHENAVYKCDLSCLCIARLISRFRLCIFNAFISFPCVR